MRTRREFLVTAGRLGLGAASIGGLVARSRASAAADASRTIHLEAREVQWELAPGKTIKAMAYNGEVPGPTIRAREGERLGAGGEQHHTRCGRTPRITSGQGGDHSGA